jgi:threonine dehydratase
VRGTNVVQTITQLVRSLLITSVPQNRLCSGTRDPTRPLPGPYRHGLSWFIVVLTEPKPMNLSLCTVVEAQTLLRRHFAVTRLLSAPSLSARCGSDVYLKLESDLPTGSFKPRGALYALSTNIARRQMREVVACSTGNHGAAVALAAKMTGIQATIFLPSNPNPVKRARIAALGARIVAEGAADGRAAFEQASQYSRTADAFFLNDATDPDLPAGPGTIALEIFEQLPSVDTVIVPMGDTALIRGVAATIKQLSRNVRVIGVQAELAPAYYLSWKQRQAISTETCNTIADGLATRVTEPGNVHDICELVDEVVLVSDEQMLDAVGHLALEERIVAEPAGSAATAALLHASCQHGRNTVCLVTGSNISPDVLRTAICRPG